MCLCHQRDILKKCADLDAFSTVCHAGVLEFVRAVRVEDRVVAYVVASGYRKGNAPSALPDAALWRGALRDMPPAPDRFRALLAPLCRMLELLFSCPVTSEDGEYNRILQYLNENYANATLDDLCRYTARSRSYISHMFRAKSGMTLRAYCNEWRLAVAKRLLRTTDRSVSEIGWDVGFHDTGYFIRTFRTAFGITPLRYRAKHTL